MSTVKHALAIALLIATSLAAAAAPTPEQDPGRPVYQEAWRLLVARSYAEAASKFELLLATYPDSYYADDSTFYLALCLEKMDRKQQAFNRYSEFLDKFTSSKRRKQVLERAVDLAQELRLNKGDVYDLFLSKHVMLQRSSPDYRLETAIRLAQLGDWSGLPLLIEGFKNSADFQQIRIAGVLRYRLDNAQVRQAMETALLESGNEIVRMYAASALAHLSMNEQIRDTLVASMARDDNHIVRLTAARALVYFVADKQVEETFARVLREERDQMILMNTIDILGPRAFEEPFRGIMKARLVGEQDPMIKFALMGAIRHGEGFDSEEMLMTLIKSPEPVVRMRALNFLAERTQDPEVRVEIVETLKTDPSISVRISALNALAGVVSEQEVREAFTFVVQTAEDERLVSTAVRVLSPAVGYPEVRQRFVKLLEKPLSLRVSAELILTLSPVVQIPEVEDAFLSVLENAPDHFTKVLVLSRLPRIEEDAKVERLVHIFSKEDPKVVSGSYYRYILRVSPKAAQRLKLVREETVPVEIESKKKVGAVKKEQDK